MHIAGRRKGSREEKVISPRDFNGKVTCTTIQGSHSKKDWVEWRGEVKSDEWTKLLYTVHVQ